MNNHLTKDQELELGRVIQTSLRAKEILALKKTDDGYNLMPVDEGKLETLIKDGAAARESLIMSNLGLVWSRARANNAKYSSDLSLEDLYQEGVIGLMKALDKYDPALKNKFSTVAYYWIEQSIGRSVNKTGRLVRSPENRVQDRMNMNKMRANLEDSGLSQREIDQKIMKDLNLSISDFMSINAAAASTASLNKPISSEGGESKDLMDYVSDKNASETSEEVVVRNEIFSILNNKIAELTPIERDVIAASFMVEGLTEKRLSIREVREEHGITAQKFKRTLNEALNKIKRYFVDQGITSEDFLKD